MIDFLIEYPVLMFLGALAIYVAVMVIWDKVTGNSIK
jgi:hypothetical protein